MAKKSYKIPDSLDKNILDMEISLKSDDGVGPRPIPIKIILAYIASAILLAFMTTMTPVQDFGPVLIFLFCILWVIATIVLLQRDQTGHVRAAYIPVMFRYLPKKKRVAITRSSDSAEGMYSITNIAQPYPEEGSIFFKDGTCGFVYEVVGTGSTLLFESDRNAVLDQVEAYNRRMRTDVEHIYMTTKEAQRVDHQVAAMNKRIASEKDPELKKLLIDQRDYLSNTIGKSYRTIHQYLILKADNPEALSLARNVLDMEVKSSNVFKQVIALSGDEMEEVFRKVYQGKESV